MCVCVQKTLKVRKTYHSGKIWSIVRRLAKNKRALFSAWSFCFMLAGRKTELFSPFFCPSTTYPHNRRRSSLDGQRQTSASSMIWFCHPSSPGGLCTFSQRRWQRDKCLCSDLPTPHGSAGRTPPFGWVGNGSLGEPEQEKNLNWNLE